MWFLLLAPAFVSAAQPLAGSARVGDGDSFSIGDVRVRLFGIDAPEFDQMCTRATGQWACGAEAADRLSSLVSGRVVHCIPVGVDDHQRVLVRCLVGGLDIGDAMVSSGHAVAFRRYSSDYVPVEGRARAAGRGLWSGTFQMPWEYRAARPLEPSTASAAKSVSRRAVAPRFRGGCTIKGNRSRRGEWIYHLPGMPYYELTRPEEIFCSEDAAQAAGYRRAKVR